ncbi:MAG: TetR/AcrR family transcriptional regulator [Anaerolineales bacterium]|jgi:AcrR family transcriptional regulator
MARPLKKGEYNARRNEILDMAQHLIYTKGYEQMTIQDLLDGLQVSKGGLYHYFDSKEALLTALVDRMGHAAERSLSPISQNPNLSAIEKLRRCFEDSAQWKTTQKEFITGLLRMWFSAENTTIRQKLTEQSSKYMASFFEPVIRQGIAEGTFTVRHPKPVAAILGGISLSLMDSITGLLASAELDAAAIQESEDLLETYTDMFERILGAPAGSLQVFEKGTFDSWLTDGQPVPAAEEKSGSKK